MKRVSEANNAQEREELLKEWLIFSVKGYVKQIQSKLEGKEMFLLPQNLEQIYEEEFKALFDQEIDEEIQLNFDQKIRLRWLYSALPLNKLIEIVKKMAIVHHKMGKKKKVKFFKFLR